MLSRRSLLGSLLGILGAAPLARFLGPAPKALGYSVGYATNVEFVALDISKVEFVQAFCYEPGSAMRSDGRFLPTHVSMVAPPEPRYCTYIGNPVPAGSFKVRIPAGEPDPVLRSA